MVRCESCRSQMLEYLYDLLEGDERQAWETHVKDCPSCQTALVEAKGQQQLLAAAVKMEFAHVRFTAPPLETDKETGRQGDKETGFPSLSLSPCLPVSLSASKRPWRRWLAAAVVLLTLGGAAIWYGRDYRRTEEIIARAEGRIEQARKDRLEAEQQLAQLPRQKQERLAAISKAQRDAQLQVEVQGPARIHAGAATDYRIYTRNLNRQLTPANVSVEVKDHGYTIAKSLAADPVAHGVYRLTLPPDLPVRPDSHPTLVVSARRDNGTQVELKEEIQLAAPVYVTHLEIDKPMYQLGETVYFRSLTLDWSTLQPAEQDLNLQFFLALPGSGSPERLIAQGRTALIEEGPKGMHPVLGPDGKPLRGIGAGSIKLDENGPSGQYALIVREANQRFAEQRRPFLVNKSEKLRRNRELGSRRQSSDPDVLKKLDIEFFPEGGDLVAGLQNRVYFQVRTTLDKPIDLQGQLLEDGKPIGVTIATQAGAKTLELNQGRGRFEFTPRAGHKYELKVESPVGVTKLYELPAIEPDGVVLSVPNGVVKADETIPVMVRSMAKRSLLIGAYCRGRLLDSTELTLEPRSHAPRGNVNGNEARTVLRPISGAGGVCRVTVFEILPGNGTRRALRPVAERLIYRQPAERVQVALKPDQKSYAPRQTVKLGVETTTEKGEPAAAVVLLRVVDKSAITLADNKTLGSMPAHFLLTTEVRRPEDLEHADFLLGPHPQAAEALDLLLGTQGWRRFAEPDPNQFRRDQKEEAQSLLVAIGQSQPQRMDLMQQELERVESEQGHRTEELTAQAVQARKTEYEARENPNYHAALVKLRAYDDFLDRLRFVAAPVLIAVLVLAALGFLVLGLFRPLGRALPYYAVTAVCGVVIVLLAKFAWQGAPTAQYQEQHVASLDTSRQPEERRLAVKREADRKAGEDAAAMPRDEAARGAGGPMAAEAGAAKLPMRVAPGAGSGVGGAIKAEEKENVAPQDHLRVAKDAAKLEQRSFPKQENEQFYLKKAVPQEPFDQKADRALAEKPAPGAEGKGQARGARMLEMTPRMQMEFRRQSGQEKQGEDKPVSWPAMPVRVFAHARAAGPAEERSDFAQTLYWNPVLVLPGGKTEVSFDLCDSLGAFEVTAFAHTLDGRLGAATTVLTSQSSGR